MADSDRAEILAPRVRVMRIIVFGLVIVGAAWLEGAAYFFLIGYFIEGNYLALGAAIVFIGLIALQFPSQLGLERWLERQQELMEQERLRNP